MTWKEPSPTALAGGPPPSIFNMVQHCAACPEPFLYFSGRIYQFGKPTDAEFFWLCDRCAAHLALECAANGQVHVVPRETAAA